MRTNMPRFFMGILSMILLLLMIVTDSFGLKLIWVFLFTLVQIIILFELFSEPSWKGNVVFQFLVVIFSFVFMLVYLLFINESAFSLFGIGVIGATFISILIIPKTYYKPLPKPYKPEEDDIQIVDIEPPSMEELKASQKKGDNVFTKLDEKENKAIKTSIAKQAKELEKAGKELEKVAKKIQKTTKPKKKKATKKKATKKKPTKRKKK